MGALDCVSVDKMKSTESTEVFAISNTSLNEPRRDVESQYANTKTAKKHSVWWTLTVDLPLLIIVGVVIGLYELGVIPSSKAGFYCNDPALSHVFIRDTVSMGAIIATVICLPLLVILPTELLFLDPDTLQRSRLVQAARNTLWLYRNYGYGIFFNLGIVLIVKGVTGNPRPTFFDICEPDTLKTCHGSEFVSDFTCTSTRYSAWFQTDSYRSFPSGHTSLSVYCGFFMAWYLQKRAFHWSHRTVFVVPVIQLACATYAAVCSFSRISDHRHHWWDVLTGAALGFATLVYAVMVLCKNFAYAKTESNDIMNEDTKQSTILLYEGGRRNGATT